MITLQQIREASGDKEAYQKFFNTLLKKFGVASPAELEGDKKKKFYDALDAGWEGDNEKPEAGDKKESVDEAVSVDCRTKGYKEAIKRNLIAKEKREAKKIKLDAAKQKACEEDIANSTGVNIAGVDKPLGKVKKRVPISFKESLDEANNGLGSFVSQMKLLLKDPKAKKAHSAASSLIMRAQEKGAMAKTAVSAIKKALPGLAKKAGGSWEKKILGMKTMMIESVELDEAKGSDCTIQNDGRNNIAVCIDGLSFADARKGTRGAMMNINDFKKKAKVAYADSKGKPTLPAVKKEIKALGAKNFYAKWQADSSSYKDDSVQIWFTK